MNTWASGEKYRDFVNFICVSCDGPDLAKAMGERMKLKDCINAVTASRKDGPFWGQLGCSGFIILSPDSQKVIAGKTKAFLQVGEVAFKHVESILDATIKGQVVKVANPNSDRVSKEGS